MAADVVEMKAELLKALAHPTRLRILELLKTGPRCVYDIMGALDLEQSNVSQHLALLKKFGLVSARKKGLRVIYQVRCSYVYEILDVLQEILLAQFQDTLSLYDNMQNESPKLVRQGSS
ncbi:MAG: ArsR/SmtB family transcription factor [Desulfotomaculales bacterium]|jgi:ArsR family transcriptional regulator